MDRRRPAARFVVAAHSRANADSVSRIRRCPGSRSGTRQAFEPDNFRSSPGCRHRCGTTALPRRNSQRSHPETVGPGDGHDTGSGGERADKGEGTVQLSGPPCGVIRGSGSEGGWCMLPSRPLPYPRLQACTRARASATRVRESVLEHRAASARSHLRRRSRGQRHADHCDSPE
jgi:hypothetical protein